MKFIAVVIFLIFPLFLRDVLLEPTFLALNVFWFIISVILFFYIYINKDKEYDSGFKEKFLKDIPGDKTPEMLGILMTGESKERFFIASVFELIRRNVIRIALTGDKKDYILINNTKHKGSLSKGEFYIIKWLFHFLGNDHEVLLTTIINEAKKNSGFFSYCFHEWSNIIEVDAAGQNIYENKGSLFNDALVYFVISYVLAIYNAIFVGSYLIAILIGFLSTVFVIYANSFRKRTRESNLEFDKWMAFIRYVKKPDNTLHEGSSLELSRLAVYLKVLKMDKDFERIFNRSRERGGNQLLVAIDTGVIKDLDKAISRGIKYSEIATNILFSKNRGSTQVFKRVYNQDFDFIYEEE